MTSDKQLATYVALPFTVGDPDGFCVAWLEKAEHTCNKPCSEYLCQYHERVALRRMEKETAKRDESNRRELAMLEPNLAAWIEERSSLTAKLDRVTSLRRHDTDDPAAYGGIGIRQTERQRRQYARRFDKALDEYRRITSRLEWLDSKIGRVERLKREAS